MDDGFFGRLSKLVTVIRTPPGVLLWIDLLLFGAGAYYGKLATSNHKTVWGMTAPPG